MEQPDSHDRTQRYPHPFVHELKLTTAQKIRGAVLGAVLFPLRVFLAALFFLIMWPIASLRLAGLSEAERAEPIQGWRRWLLHTPVQFLSRAVFFSLGFLWIRVKGRQAGPKEAPLLAVAPHSSFLDILVLVPAGLPTVVSRSENCSLPVIGALLEFNQALLVSRKDPESRKQCVTQLRERLTSNGRWPQILMYPEGTTTNGTALIKFKPGAFMAGVPVQPVLLRYPNKLDTVRWTWKGTSWVQALWYTTSQLYTNLTVEYLPVYTPSEEEKENPALYAENVQKLMADALGIPATDYVMESRMPVSKLGCVTLPLEPPARDALKLLQQAGVSDMKAVLKLMIDSCHSGQEERVSADQLASLLGLTDRQTATKICTLYSKGEQVDLRQLAVSVAAISGLWTVDSLIHTAFTLFHGGCKGCLSEAELELFFGALVGYPQPHTAELYKEMANRGQPTQDNLQALLTEHATYQRLFPEYLQPGETAAPPSANGGPGSHSTPVQNGTAASRKKAD
ncbi:lysophospholipid acyltransferase LPCAT4 [Megalops cyprinoides]|uniref:lysophospholipid acyltransferase LPCAT4 n=1 Tax=Megalops cyprinoides TaxID=118141 RepID=UPI001864D5E2|nr:lysophospholipid acyltransferase LPCAT4 [Megalops cyprinoides]